MKDFRDNAVEHSKKRLGDRFVEDPAFSCCLPSGVDAGVRTAMRRALILLVSGGAVLLLFAFLVALSAEKEENSQWRASAAIISMISGFVVLLSGGFYSRRKVRGILGDRYKLLKSRFRDQVVYFSMEDARTFEKTKVLPEDEGYFAIDPDEKIMILEGISHRYVVRSEDVMDCRIVRHGGSVGVFLSVRVAGAALEFVIQSNTIIDEIKRQTIGLTRNALFEMIRKKLQPAVLLSAADEP